MEGGIERRADYWLVLASLPEVAGDGEAAQARGVDVGAGGEGPGGDVGGAALEEEAASLEPARGGELGGEDAGLGGLDLLLGLRQQGNGEEGGAAGEAGELGFGGADEEGSGGRDVQEGEAVVARVLHLPDALLEGGGELHRGAGAGGGGRWFGFDWAGKVRGVAVRTGTNAQDQRVVAYWI